MYAHTTLSFNALIYGLLFQWLSTEFSSLYSDIITALNRYGVEYSLLPNTEDYWCRDYMPIQLNNGRFLRYKYFLDNLNTKRNRQYITDPKMVQLSYPTKHLDDRSWVYINFLQTDSVILLPKLGIPEDDFALSQIEQQLLNYCGRIVQIDVSELIKNGGALNCISWEK